MHVLVSFDAYQFFTVVLFDCFLTIQSGHALLKQVC